MTKSKQNELTILGLHLQMNSLKRASLTSTSQSTRFIFVLLSKMFVLFLIWCVVFASFHRTISVINKCYQMSFDLIWFDLLILWSHYVVSRKHCHLVKWKLTLIFNSLGWWCARVDRHGQKKTPRTVWIRIKLFEIVIIDCQKSIFGYIRGLFTQFHKCFSSIPQSNIG